MNGNGINIIVIVAVIILAIFRAVNKTKTEATNQPAHESDLEEVFGKIMQERSPKFAKSSHKQKASDSIEFTARKSEVSQMPSAVPEREQNVYLSEIVNDFDLTRAVIYAEILKPKFEEEDL